MDKKLITILLSVVLTIPLFVAIMSNLEMFTFAPGDVGHWIGFWGSYLGAIIGMIAIFITTQITLRKSEDSLNKQLLLQREEVAFWRLIDIMEKQQKGADDSISKKIQIYKDTLTHKKSIYLYDNHPRIQDLIFKIESHQNEIINRIFDYIKEVYPEEIGDSNNIFVHSSLIQFNTPFADEFRKLVDRNSYSDNQVAFFGEDAEELYELALLENFQELYFIHEESENLASDENYREYMNECEKNAKDELINNQYVEKRVELIKIIKEHQNEIKSKLAHSYYRQVKSKETLELEKIFKVAE